MSREIEDLELAGLWANHKEHKQLALDTNLPGEVMEQHRRKAAFWLEIFTKKQNEKLRKS